MGLGWRREVARLTSQVSWSSGLVVGSLPYGEGLYARALGIDEARAERSTESS